jgi:hypothetical protein
MLSSSQDTVAKAHGFNRFQTLVIATFKLVQLRSIFQERRGVSVFNAMTSATTLKINPNNCAHAVQSLGTRRGNYRYYRHEGQHASGKEGIKGNDQVDNSTSLCKPEDLFPALAHIENKLARAWLHKCDGEFPLIRLQHCLNIMFPIMTGMSWPYGHGVG